MEPDPFRGKTLRWTFDDGPTAGKTYEHTFGTDGTVSWRIAGSPQKNANEPSAHYEVARLTDDVYAISYLSDSGFTLTTVLEMNQHIAVAFASNEEQLFVQHGTFETVKRAA